jgi:hypothetical protein
METWQYSPDASLEAIMKICNRYNDEGFDPSLHEVYLDVLISEIASLNEWLSEGNPLPSSWRF